MLDVMTDALLNRLGHRDEIFLRTNGVVYFFAFGYESHKNNIFSFFNKMFESAKSHLTNSKFAKKTLSPAIFIANRARELEKTAFERS